LSEFKSIVFFVLGCNNT